MYFTDIKNMWPDENKQRVSLSNYAMEVILQDEEELFPTYIRNRERKPGKAGTTEKEGISSTIINHIAESFFETADATIPLRLEQKEQVLHQQLSGMLSGKLLDDAVDQLLKPYCEELENKRDWLLQMDGSSFMIRLSAGVIQKLTEDSLYGREKNISSLYDDRVGKYLKVLLEEYARKEYVERERLVVSETIQNIENAISGKKMLKLTLRKDFRTEYMKAFRIQTDDEGLYNYVLGYVSPNGKDPWMEAVMRLSDIERAEVRSGSGFLSKEDKNRIENSVRTKGPQFISEAGSGGTIRVEFTEEGERLYKRIRHLRPQYTRKTGSRTYEFSCSRIQARYYFFKFGADARILSPESLADEFCLGYEQAVERYKK